MTTHSYDALTIRALRIALGDNDNGALEYANEYGEPGHSQPEQGILLANWNRIEEEIARRLAARGMTHDEQRRNIARRRSQQLQDRLEAQGYELEWADEWIVDFERSPCKAYRTSPDSYHWEACVRFCDGYILTPDDDGEEWIRDSLNDDSRPLPSWFDESELESYGFVRTNKPDREVGFHPGQDETPDKLTPELRARGLDYVLQVTDRGQFDVSYTVWTRKPEEVQSGEGARILRDCSSCPTHAATLMQTGRPRQSSPRACPTTLPIDSP